MTNSKEPINQEEPEVYRIWFACQAHIEIYYFYVKATMLHCNTISPSPIARRNGTMPGFHPEHREFELVCQIKSTNYAGTYLVGVSRTTGMVVRT